jgi:hypothetical protein
MAQAILVFNVQKMFLIYWISQILMALVHACRDSLQTLLVANVKCAIILAKRARTLLITTAYLALEACLD